MTPRTRIPRTGRDPAPLLAEMASFRDHDVRYQEGRSWSLVYYVGEAHEDVLRQAQALYISANALNPMAFRSLKQMETEVVQMTAEMLHGPPSCVGTMTCGGTESLLLAVKAYRDRARRRRPWIRRPNIVAPATIHVAFDKAAHYFGVNLRLVPVGLDGQVDPRAMARRVNRNTILLAASAPQYANGAVDPIPEIGALAERRGLPLHVDACFGGFIQPWLERLGVSMPQFDFRVPGVTSVSADVHKYGYAAKGASVVLYRDMAYLKHQFFVATRWSGGIYASPGVLGARPGGPIAGAWASLMAMGEDGFVAKAREAWDAAEKLRAGIREIPQLRLLGQPHSTIVTYGVEERAVDLYAVADQLQERGWGVDRQQRPPSIHCTVNAANLPVVDRYLADLRAAVAHVEAHPELATEGEAAMYGMMAKVPVRGLVGRRVLEVMEQMYGPEGEMPDLAASGAEQGGPVVRAVLDWGDRAISAAKRVGHRVRHPFEEP
ncbi:MAG: aspartate aminotransferase family protein [Deltaproteobacteria bacterium]|nr:aspartate aminotransferase family protein [Deltaproteobacteria bacterium]